MTVSLFLTDYSAVTVTLIDLTGKVILKENRPFTAGQQTFVLGLQDAAPGFYLLKAETGKGLWVGKLEIR